MSSIHRPKQSYVDPSVRGAVIRLKGISGSPTVDATSALPRTGASEVAGTYYLSISAELIELVEMALKPAALEPDAAELDKRLTEQSTAAGSNCVGFCGSAPLQYNSLHPRSAFAPNQSDARLRGVGHECCET